MRLIHDLEIAAVLLAQYQVATAGRATAYEQESVAGEKLRQPVALEPNHEPRYDCLAHVFDGAAEDGG